MLVYIVVMTLVLGAMVYFLSTAHKVYQATILETQANRVGTLLINELLRRTREGVAIDPDYTGFDTAIGSMTFSTLDGSGISFALDGERIMFRDGDADPVALTPDSIAITRFWLTRIDTPVSEGVRYDIGITYPLRDTSVTKYYQGVAVLRQSYE